MIALEKALTKLGYALQLNEGRKPPAVGYRIDAQGSNGRNERFVIDLNDNIELVPLDTNVREEGVLILIRDRAENQNLAKLLLGHDERQLFVAAAPLRAKTVLEVKEELKPAIVRRVERQADVRAKKKHKHRNEARVRQGDFFFIPTEDSVDETLLQKNQPLRRGRGNAHMLEEAVEIGGEAGYESGGRFIRIREYNRLDDRSKELYRQTRRNARIYARGKVRHPEHRTIVLKGWHLVVPNTEAGMRDFAGRPVLGRMAYTD